MGWGADALLPPRFSKVGQKRMQTERRGQCWPTEPRSPTNSTPSGRAVLSTCPRSTPEERLGHKHRVLEPLCSPAPHSHSFPWAQPLQLPTLLFIPSHPPVPNQPGVSQTHPRLTPAAQSSASQSSPSGLLVLPGPGRCLLCHLLPASPVKLRHGEVGSGACQLHPTSSSSGKRRSCVQGSNPQSLDSVIPCEPSLVSTQLSPTAASLLPLLPTLPSPSKPRNSFLTNRQRTVPCSLQRLALRGEADRRAMNSEMASVTDVATQSEPAARLHRHRQLQGSNQLHLLKDERVSCSVVSGSLRPYGEGSRSLLQGILPTQGSNPGLLHCRQVLYHLSPYRMTSEKKCQCKT